MTDSSHDRVTRMIRLATPPETVWREIGDFEQAAGWHPAFASSEATEIEGERYRRITTTEGEQYFDRLIETGPLRYAYETVEGPLALSDFRAILACVAEKDGGCHVYWSARFEPPEGQERQADELVGALFEIGLAALPARFA